MMTQELLKKAELMMAKTENVTIASIDENGYPRAATMSKLKTEGISEVWFSTGTNSHKTLNFKRNTKASVSFTDYSNNITLIGDIVIIEDMEIKKALWVDWFIKHFPLGINDPNYCVMKFETKYIQAYIDDEFEETIL